MFSRFWICHCSQSRVYIFCYDCLRVKRSRRLASGETVEWSSGRSAPSHFIAFTIIPPLFISKYPGRCILSTCLWPLLCSQTVEALCHRLLLECALHSPLYTHYSPWVVGNCEMRERAGSAISVADRSLGVRTTRKCAKWRLDTGWCSCFPPNSYRRTDPLLMPRSDGTSPPTLQCTLYQCRPHGMVLARNTGLVFVVCLIST